MSLIQSGVVSVTFRKKTPLELIDLAAKAGLSGIEWGSDVHVLPGDAAAAREVRDLTEAHGLSVASYGSYYYAAKEDQAPFEAFLESAVALGAPNIRIWAGLGASKDADVAHRARVAEDAARVAALAKKAQITVSFEYHANTLTDTLASTLELLDTARSDNLFTYWQPPLDVADAQQGKNLDVLLARGVVTNAHVYRFKFEPLEQVPLIEGKALWRGWLKQLNNAPRFAMIEFVAGGGDAQFLEDCALLNQMLSEL